jgi:hypothetical protein
MAQAITTLLHASKVITPIFPILTSTKFFVPKTSTERRGAPPIAQYQKNIFVHIFLNQMHCAKSLVDTLNMCVELLLEEVHLARGVVRKPIDACECFDSVRVILFI